MLFSHLGRPSQAIIKVVLWGHPVFLQHVTANKKRNDTHSPWDYTVCRLQLQKTFDRTCKESQQHEIVLNNPWLTARAHPHLFCWLTECAFIRTTSSHTNLNFLLAASRSKNVPITGWSSWQWFKWARTMLSEAAERSICMKITVASNSWVHLFTSLQTGDL